jgi:hypothetical protein
MTRSSEQAAATSTHFRGALWRTRSYSVHDEPRKPRAAIELSPVTCYVPPMATTPKKSKPRTSQQRMATRRERLRAQGLRPVQHWVPDLRDPKVLAEIRREIKLMAQHPENDAIDDWIESVYDWESWK